MKRNIENLLCKAVAAAIQTLAQSLADPIEAGEYEVVAISSGRSAEELLGLAEVRQDLSYRLEHLVTGQTLHHKVDDYLEAEVRVMGLPGPPTVRKNPHTGQWEIKTVCGEIIVRRKDNP